MENTMTLSERSVVVTDFPRVTWIKWEKNVKPVIPAGTSVVAINHFAPRPYVDMYNRGSRHEGFLWTTSKGRICVTEWVPGEYGIETREYVDECRP